MGGPLRNRLEEAAEEEALTLQELSTSNYRLNIILDSLAQGVAQYDRQGRLQAANASARRLIPEGTLGDLERCTLDEEGRAWPPESHPVTRALRAGQACAGVVLGLARTPGAPVWVSLTATPLLYRAREPWGVVVSLIDITPQRQVRRQRELVADLLQMAHQAATAERLALDMVNRLALWSGCAGVAITLREGETRRTFPSRAFPEAPGELPPVEGPERLVRGTRALTLIPAPVGEGRTGLWQFADPQEGRFEDLPLPVLAEVAAIASNILAKALAEEDLRERAEALARSRAMLAQAQALAGLGSWELDLATESQKWSPETYLHWDCDPGRPIPSLSELAAKVHPEDREAFQAFHRHLRDSDFPLELEFRVQPSPGVSRHLFTQGIPLKGLAEPPGRIQGAILDITQRKVSEIALRDMERLSAKGQMAAYIAHEINNPLAGIRNAFLLLEGSIPADHPHRPYVPLITREIDRIGSIIRTMYHLYRPDPAQTRRVALQELFQDLESLLAPKCRAQSARIAFDLEGLREPGSAHEGFLRQVLFNLIQNALEASPNGGVVDVQARSGRSRLEVSVADQGPGIPPDQAERIFQPGFTTKLDSTMSGLGLGLATCRSLVESMGGTLDFRGGPKGAGTVFTLRIPFPA